MILIRSAVVLRAPLHFVSDCKPNRIENAIGRNYTGGGVFVQKCQLHKKSGHNRRSCAKPRPVAKRQLLSLQIEQSTVGLQLALTEGICQAFHHVGGQDSVFMEAITGKVAGEAVQVHRSGNV